MKTLNTIKKEVRTINNKFNTTSTFAEKLLLIVLPVVFIITTVSLYI